MTKASSRASVVSASSCFFPNVTLRHGVSHDHLVGTAQSLIAAGLVTQDQLPGQPGRGRMMTSFNADGTPRLKGCSSRGWLEEGAKKITKLSAGRYRVDWAVAAEEMRRRLAEYCMEQWAKRGALNVIRAASESSRGVAFEVGDGCISVFEMENVRCVVVGGYGVRDVKCWDGRVIELPGYLVQSEDDEEIFFRTAGQLLDLEFGR